VNKETKKGGQSDLIKAMRSAPLTSQGVNISAQILGENQTGV